MGLSDLVTLAPYIGLVFFRVNQPLTLGIFVDISTILPEQCQNEHQPLSVATDPTNGF
jgi:hypothetical protein